MMERHGLCSRCGSLWFNESHVCVSSDCAHEEFHCCVPANELSGRDGTGGCSPDSAIWAPDSASLSSEESLDAKAPDSKIETERSDKEVATKSKKIFGLPSHIEILEGYDTPMYWCVPCSRVFRAKDNCRYHRYCLSGQKPFRCELCSKTFAKKSQQECHMRMHSGERAWECHICSKSFNEKNQLNSHRQCHPTSVLSCPECGKAYNYRKSLVVHMRTHTGDRPFRCSQCPMSYRDKDCLRKHVRNRHSGGRHFYVCEVCGKSFKLKTNLVNHKVLHGKVKPHICDTCDKSFFLHKELTRHKQTHSDIKDFECTHCNTLFRRKDNLERHVRNTHLDAAAQQIPAMNGDFMPHLSLVAAEKSDCSLLETNEKLKAEPKKRLRENFASSKSAKMSKAFKKHTVSKSQPVSVIRALRKSDESEFKTVVKKPKSMLNGREFSKTLSLREDLIRNTEEKKELFPKVFSYNSPAESPKMPKMKAMHIVQTSSTGESGVETIVTTAERGDIATLLNSDVKLKKTYTIDMVSGLYSEALPVGVIRHTCLFSHETTSKPSIAQDSVIDFTLHRPSVKYTSRKERDPKLADNETDSRTNLPKRLRHILPNVKLNPG